MSAGRATIPRPDCRADAWKSSCSPQFPQDLISLTRQQCPSTMVAMDLQTIVNLAQLAGTATIIGGTAFALMQLREFRIQRRHAAAGELMRTFMGAEFADAMSIVMNIPDASCAEEVRVMGPNVERAATLICTTFETIGVLVYEQVTPFPLVMELTGGSVVVLWRKLGPWVVQLRKESSNPCDSEWFQWLAEQCEWPGATKVPAYMKHRGWAARRYGHLAGLSVDGVGTTHQTGE